MPLYAGSDWLARPQKKPQVAGILNRGCASVSRP